MNEGINLCEILKKCPENTVFYSSIYGHVTVCIVDICKDYPIALYKPTMDGSVLICRLTKEGKYNKQFNGECTLFPSKDQRDWSKFTASWYKREKFDPKTLKPFDKVLVSVGGEWQCDLFSHMLSGDIFNKRCIGVGDMNVVIPYNDETKHLVGTKDEAPDYYKYWINNN